MLLCQIMWLMEIKVAVNELTDWLKHSKDVNKLKILSHFNRFAFKLHGSYQDLSKSTWIHSFQGNKLNLYSSLPIKYADVEGSLEHIKLELSQPNFTQLPN